MKSKLKPVFIEGEKIKVIESLKKDHSGLIVRDEYLFQLEELFLLRNPKYRFIKDYKEDFSNFVLLHQKGKEDLSECGNWVHFSWINTVVHVLEESDFFEMRTGRNRNLVTQEEQIKFYNSTIALAGLSVGSHAANTIVMSGGAKNFRIADPDVFSGPNLNRVRTGVQNIGIKKAHIVAMQLFESNPYTQLEIYDEGVSEENIDKFLDGADLLIEEMDNPYFKFRVREKAKEKGIPVIMATDNGDNIFVDIERHDLEPELEIFNGKVKHMTSQDLKALDPRLLPKVAAQIAGAEIATTRMQQSVLEVGKTLYSWPQLGIAANLCGSALAFLARNIINDYSNFRSGRYEVNLEKIMDADYEKNREYREAETKKFLTTLGL